MLGSYAVISNWWLQEKLGSGYSGSIFKAINVHTQQVVALKVQDIHHECPTNRYERSLYPLLQGGKGMPTLWAAGVEGQWDYLAIDLLGASLDSLYKTSGKDSMDLRSVCCIAMQVISRLEFMHSRGILHRDIQLGNCVVGLPPNEKTIYMIDFGFSKRYIDPYTNRHIPDSTAKRDFIGNFWFTSVGVHCRGKVPSRRDDLEAVALMLIHLLTPRGLSWTRNGVPKTDSAFDRLENEKRAARPETLCKGLPGEFEEFLRYCRRLKFKECPDYGKWREAFRELAEDEGFSASDEFIWPPPKTEARHTPNTPRRKAAPADVERVLNDLANLELDDRQILGNRQNVVDAVQKAKKDAKTTETKSVGTAEDSESTDIIEISSGSEASIPPRFLMPKAQKLNKLCKRLSSATDNLAVAQAVTEFVEVLQMNKSRTLTKEGFEFLDVLHKQLADPSMPIMPLRTRSSDTEQVAHVKLGVVARLRREVESATGNGSLAKMIADFGAVTNKSSGRTVTKDGIAFLEGLGRKLKEL